MTGLKEGKSRLDRFRGSRAPTRRPMLEGLYTAAAGMAAQQQRMDALSNDVANVNTAGYKRVRIGFRDLVYQADGPSGVRTGSGSAAVQLGRGFEQGTYQQTGNPFDLAI